jgi:hypothetical protein
MIAMITRPQTRDRDAQSALVSAQRLPNGLSALKHATRLIHRVCCLAGSADYIDELRTDNAALRTAINDHDTPALFDWLMAGFNYQGISDRAAESYMDQHGRASWHDLECGLANTPTCPRLESYWQFHGCGYHKTSGTCAEPEHIARCPLPIHDLRNGRLNQTAYSLYLFIRDIANNAWSNGSTLSWSQDAKVPALINLAACATPCSTHCVTCTASQTKYSAWR